MGCGASAPKKPAGPQFAAIKPEHKNEDGSLNRDLLLTYIFGHCDDDGDGKLSVTELMQLSRSQTKEARTLQAGVFNAMDADGSGDISVAEFKKYNMDSGASLDDQAFNDQAQEWLELAKARDVSK